MFDDYNGQGLSKNLPTETGQRENIGRRYGSNRRSTETIEPFIRVTAIVRSLSELI